MSRRNRSEMTTNEVLCSDPEVPASNPAHARIRMIRHNLAAQAAAAERRGLWLDQVDGTIFEAAATLKTIIARVAPTVDFPAELIPAPSDPHAAERVPDDDDNDHGSAGDHLDPVNATPVAEDAHYVQHQQAGNPSSDAYHMHQQQVAHHRGAPSVYYQGHQHDADDRRGYPQQQQQQQQQPYHPQGNPQQSGMNSDCPADLTAWLCAAPVGAHGLNPQQFAVALSNLAPAQLQRQSGTFFRGLIPTLVAWLRDPCSAAQALALLHEGFVVNEQLRTSLQGRQVAEAISGLFLSSSAGANHARASNVDLNVAAVLAQHLATANGLLVPGVR